MVVVRKERMGPGNGPLRQGKCRVSSCCQGIVKGRDGEDVSNVPSRHRTSSMIQPPRREQKKTAGWWMPPVVTTIIPIMSVHARVNAQFHKAALSIHVYAQTPFCRITPKRETIGKRDNDAQERLLLSILARTLPLPASSSSRLIVRLCANLPLILAASPGDGDSPSSSESSKNDMGCGSGFVRGAAGMGGRGLLRSGCTAFADKGFGSGLDLGEMGTSKSAEPVFLCGVVGRSR